MTKIKETADRILHSIFRFRSYCSVPFANLIEREIKITLYDRDKHISGFYLGFLFGGGSISKKNF